MIIYGWKVKTYIKIYITFKKEKSWLDFDKKYKCVSIEVYYTTITL